MSSIAIYMEGGGNSAHRKAALRQGMDEFLVVLKKTFIEKSWNWRLVLCGGRAETFKFFRKAVQQKEHTIVALLVDAEAEVKGSPLAHLKSRDGWDLGVASEEVIHLMVQTMETWIVADPDALTRYYGRGFQRNELPEASNLEIVTKKDVAKALKEATRRTKKGVYQKIDHASDLLQEIDPEKVRKRCPHCARLFDRLLRLIQKA